jgi:hypothetical protein
MTGFAHGRPSLPIALRSQAPAMWLTAIVAGSPHDTRERRRLAKGVSHDTGCPLVRWLSGIELTPVAHLEFFGF